MMRSLIRHRDNFTCTIYQPHRELALYSMTLNGQGEREREHGVIILRAETAELI
jgi:hypothetical protein